jgi:beta-glucanase (GH16 family)
MRTLKLVAISGLILSQLTSTAFAGWQVEWIDRFEQNEVNWNNWTAQTQANYNNEVQCYTDDESSSNKNLDVSDGTLKIIARRQSISCPGLNGAQKSWTSGRLNGKDKQEFLYGRIEARIRFDSLEGGSWPAFWMLENRIAEQPRANDNDFVNWPNPGAGEIDVWEWFSNSPSTYITNFFNTNNCGSEVRHSYPSGAADVLDWHDYAIEWTEAQIQFFMDDTLVTTQNISNCPQYKEPMFVLINVAMGGNLGGNIDAGFNQATMEIDYLAHCSQTSSNSNTRCNQSTPLAADDDDNDGVENSLDLCPNTPQNVEVDSSGCEIVQQQNMAPEVSISILQNGQNTSTINVDDGLVTISAIVTDDNPDDIISVVWTLENIPSPNINGDQFSFDPSSMAAGSYQITVTANDDGDPILSDELSISLSVQAEPEESNGGGGSLGFLFLIFCCLRLVLSNKVRLIAQRSLY